MEAQKITAQEKQLIRVIRAMDGGELRIVVKDSRPVRVEQVRKNICLTGSARNRPELDPAGGNSLPHRS